MKAKFLLAGFLLATGGLFAQNETNRWYFGAYAGLNFNTNPPTTLTNSGMYVDEGCTSASDANGNLLFYGSASAVFNQQHSAMANGMGLSGHNSSSQGALAVKQPGNSNIYYYFTLDAQNMNGLGLSYSIINMSLAAGMGSVTTKNVPLYTPSTEKLTAVKHCNGVDVWIMSHDWNSDAFRAYLLTAAGINPTPVVTTIGQVHSGGPTNNSMAMGCMKFSPSGHKLAVSIPGPGNYANVELYDFDRATGIVSNQLILVGNMFQPYGCEFSHDGSRLYAGGWYTPLYQWDLCAGSGPAIVASQYTTATTQITGMQMASNGKIYVSRAYQQQLGVINNPNALGAACNYVNLAQSVAPKSLMFNLPNFVTSYFDQSPAPAPALPFSYNVSCQTASFTAQLPAPLVTCTSPSYSVTNALWDFGDPLSGASNTSAAFNPLHTYSAAGSYTVKLILYRCKTDTLVQTITIAPSGPNLALTGPASLCAGNAAALMATGAASYSWSTGATSPGITVSPATTTVYSVVGTGTDNCQSAASFTMAVLPVPILTLTGTSTVICSGESATLTANGATTYTWTQATTTASTMPVSPTVTTIYSVSGTSAATGCGNSATVSITVSKCTGMEDAGAAAAWNMYYSEQQLVIESDAELSADVISINGSVVIEARRCGPGRSVLDLSGLSSGVYIVRSVCGTGIKTLKVVKE